VANLIPAARGCKVLPSAFAEGAPYTSVSFLLSLWTSMAFKKELILFLSKQKSYLKDFKKGERQTRYRYRIYKSICNKVTIPEGQDNDHSLGNKRKRKQNLVLQFKSKICSLSRSVDGMRTKKVLCTFPRPFPSCLKKKIP